MTKALRGGVPHGCEDMAVVVVAAEGVLLLIVIVIALLSETALAAVSDPLQPLFCRKLGVERHLHLHGTDLLPKGLVLLD
jgi:hypothetical protein